jgi:hypothetical protein
MTERFLQSHPLPPKGDAIGQYGADEGAAHKLPQERKPFGWDGGIKYITLLVVIAAALSPALFFSFGYHNDFNAWAYDAQSCCTHHPETVILTAIGRYFGAIAENLQFLTIRTLHDFWMWRLVGIVSTALLAAYYLHIVSLDHVPTWRDVFLSVAVFTLPTMQWQAIWVSMYMFWTPPMLLALIAAHIFRIAALRTGILPTVRLAALGFIALLAGVFFYPASAMFVLVPTAHLVLTQNAAWARKMAVVAVVGLGSAFVSLFLIQKYIVLPHMSVVPYLGDYKFDFANGLIAEATWRLGQYLWEAAYLWMVLEVPWFAKIIALGALASLGYRAGSGCLNSFPRMISGVPLSTLINPIFACGLFLVAAAPLVTVHQFTQTYRVTLTMTGIELLVFFWLLKQLPINPAKLASAFAAIGAVLAFAGVYGMAAATATEFALYARAVADLSPASREHFLPIVVLRQIYPDHARQAFGLDLREDFGSLGLTDHTFDLLIGPRYSGKAAFDVTEFQLPAVDGVPIALEKNALIIDTSAIYGVPNFKDFSHRVGIVSAQPRGTIGPMYALDHNAMSFWEVCGPAYPQPFPITFELDLPSARTLTGYSLSTIEEPGRMPNAWDLWVSSDLENWRRVEQVIEGGKWKIEETRHYQLEPLPAVKGIKLVIMGTDVGPCMRLYEFTPAFASE